jgi:VCBS repeat-containing protein
VEERIGQQLGSYRLVHLLGQGGFADVYLGEHIHLQTLAAVKVLQMRLVGSNLEQFRNEARTIASLIHPHIVRVLDFGVEDGVPFLVMEYAPHGTLRQAYPKGTCLSPIHVLPYINQIADALYYAHSRKLIHRDIKPENILLAADGKILLSDFGLVQTVQNTTSQTTKEMAGTIAYMSPEQINGKPRPASDQYALGVVAYEWLSGDRPFQGSIFEIATQHMMSTPRSLCGNIPNISPEVEMVVFRALAKDPQQRFPTVKEFARAFEQASRATQGSDPSLPTVILSSPFSTTLMSAMSQSGLTNDAPGQPQQIAASNVTPVISPPQSGIPTPVDPARQAMQVNTPPQLGGPLSSIHSSQSQPLLPAAGNTLPCQPVVSNYSNHPYNQSMQPTYVNVPSDKATIQKPYNLQRPFVPSSMTMPARSMGQPAKSTLPAIAPSRRPLHQKSGKQWWIILTLVLLVVIVSGIVVYALAQGSADPSADSQTSLMRQGSSPKVPTDRSPVSVPVPPGFATINVTSTSKVVKNVFTISAVTGTPDSTQSQVQARQVSASQSQSQTTTTTGSKQLPATRATGTLTVTCRASSPALTINAGTVFTGNDKVSVVTDTTVTTSGCHTTVPAHAVNPGQSGNIAVNDINQPYQGYNVLNEAAFSRGQDAKTTAVVAQNDIDTTASSLETALTPAVKQALPGKLNANERSFGDPQCSPNVTSDHAAGDEAAKVTVTVTMSCTVEAYDNDGAQAMAKKLLSNQAANDPGSGYGLTGNITTAVGQPTLVDTAHGTFSLPVNAEGIWVYQWNDAQKQDLAKLVAGRSAQDAKMLLQGQKGVSAVNIQLSSGSNGVLPSEASHITVDVTA